MAKLNNQLENSPSSLGKVTGRQKLGVTGVGQECDPETKRALLTHPLKTSEIKF